ncbi:MAG: hypothetical protein MJZ93_01995, partial [Paludibacteraceae bacterium]|nr:hypothetical protein [Paludibacteraceae bacterium]
MKKSIISLAVLTAVCFSANAGQPVQDNKKSDTVTTASEERTVSKKEKTTANFRDVVLYKKNNPKANPKFKLAKRIDM